jgi:hypothetical protein
MNHVAPNRWFWIAEAGGIFNRNVKPWRTRLPQIHEPSKILWKSSGKEGKAPAKPRPGDNCEKLTLRCGKNRAALLTTSRPNLSKHNHLTAWLILNTGSNNPTTTTRITDAITSSITGSIRRIISSS